MKRAPELFALGARAGGRSSGRARERLQRGGRRARGTQGLWGKSVSVASSALAEVAALRAASGLSGASSRRSVRALASGTMLTRDRVWEER